jgi:hypothetical protein
MRFGTWNVRSLYRLLIFQVTVSNELSKFSGSAEGQMGGW